MNLHTHSLQQKQAVFHSMFYRLIDINVSMNKEDFDKKPAVIKQIAISNCYNKKYSKKLYNQVLKTSIESLKKIKLNF